MNNQIIIAIILFSLGFGFYFGAKTGIYWLIDKHNLKDKRK